MTLFKDFGLKPGIMSAIEKAGYTEPTQIQAEVWEAAKSGQNIVGQSQTGTGKTTAFLLPLLEKADNKKRHPQVLIVAPTRELVEQIRADIMKLSDEIINSLSINLRKKIKSIINIKNEAYSIRYSTN